MFTVKQLSDMTGVTGRTLCYYDGIGLLKPSRIGDNGYRYYNEADLLRLQQVLAGGAAKPSAGELASAMPQGASSEAVQALVKRWHAHLRAFWPAERDHLPSLAATYRDDPGFRANLDQVHPDLAPFMVEAVCTYCA